MKDATGQLESVALQQRAERPAGKNHLFGTMVTTGGA